MGNETTYSGVIGELTRIATALEANAADLTHLEGPRVRLGNILGSAKEVAQQQASLKASKQESSKHLKELIVEGRRVATGIVRFLQQHYGNRSEKLAEFGLQPFRGRKPRTAKTPSPTVPPTTPTPTPTHAVADVNPKQ
jgi:UDP-N-acetylmuramyl tripeptide synthase